MHVSGREQAQTQDTDANMVKVGDDGSQANSLDLDSDRYFVHFTSLSFRKTPSWVPMVLKGEGQWQRNRIGSESWSGPGLAILSSHTLPTERNARSSVEDDLGY